MTFKERVESWTVFIIAGSCLNMFIDSSVTLAVHAKRVNVQ